MKNLKKMLFCVALTLIFSVITSFSVLAQVKTCKCDNKILKYEGTKNFTYLNDKKDFKLESYALLKSDTVYFYELTYRIKDGKETIAGYQQAKMAVKDFAEGQVDSELSINIAKGSSANEYNLTFAPAPFVYNKNAVVTSFEGCGLGISPSGKRRKETTILGKFENEADAKAFLLSAEKIMVKYKKK
jgi:hypothetical protein